ncbi:hypothetical protein M404DRAFT_692656 [Pisolithus tinctorius Marx 270]|uniref:Uncharacterized protein n=1 Tax=Pisolithus tinctorius Marx 270 TaxID=870435 RepID=A0A0C3JUC3_PISTI|nr:hypothetical protein M404DRAFT_692656 [Pisolithus tinctorius Marx 270]
MFFSFFPLLHETSRSFLPGGQVFSSTLNSPNGVTKTAFCVMEMEGYNAQLDGLGHTPAQCEAVLRALLTCASHSIFSLSRIIDCTVCTVCV